MTWKNLLKSYYMVVVGGVDGFNVGCHNSRTRAMDLEVTARTSAWSSSGIQHVKSPRDKLVQLKRWE